MASPIVRATFGESAVCAEVFIGEYSEGIVDGGEVDLKVALPDFVHPAVDQSANQFGSRDPLGARGRLQRRGLCLLEIDVRTPHTPDCTSGSRSFGPVLARPAPPPSDSTPRVGGNRRGSIDANSPARQPKAWPRTQKCSGAVRR